jgi:hypothetical protein
MYETVSVWQKTLNQHQQTIGTPAHAKQEYILRPREKTGTYPRSTYNDMENKKDPCRIPHKKTNNFIPQRVREEITSKLWIKRRKAGRTHKKQEWKITKKEKRKYASERRK